MEELKVRKRSLRGKIGARKLRKQGFIPATLYHRGDSSICIAVPERDMHRIIRHHGESGLVQLNFEGDDASSQQAVYKDVQTDVFSSKLVHVDFLGVRTGEKVTMTVSINLSGAPVGVTEGGGTLVQQLNEISIRCLPRNIPESLEVDISHLNVRETFTAADLALPEGVELYHVEPQATIASVVEARKVAATPGAESEETAVGEEATEAATGDTAATAAGSE